MNKRNPRLPLIFAAALVAAVAAVVSIGESDSWYALVVAVVILIGVTVAIVRDVWWAADDEPDRPGPD
jgi:predicted MFS family arabinose efflux permease